MRSKICRPRFFRPEIEQLEDRQLLALIINPTFDASITNDANAATIKSTINTAIAAFQGSFSDAITVNIVFKKDLTINLAQSLTQINTAAYSAYRAALVSHATTADDTTALASLPTGTTNPVNSGTNLTLTTPLLRALGLSSGTTATDGTISLNTSVMNLSRMGTPDLAKFDLLAVTEHEIDEVLAGGSALDGLANGAAAPATIQPLDLFRYSAANVRSYNTTASVLPNYAYFSIDGGVTDLANFNQQAGGDFGDWFSYFGGQTPQVQDAFATPGAKPNLGVELRRLDVLGFTLGTTTVGLDASNNLVVKDVAGRNDTLTIQADTANSRYVINMDSSAYLVFASTITGATISVDNHTAFVPFAAVTGTQITVNTVAGNDSLTVDLSLGAFPKLLNVDGGAGTDTLVCSSGNNTWNLTGANAGNITGVVSSFANVENLTGGTGRDVFKFAANGSVSGKINGGAGNNWLDYSAINSVVVNLSTGATARVAGGVQGFNNVIGSAAGADKLTGNAAGGVLLGHGKGNTITAGSSRSVLIGGFGVNNLAGGAADDLIINGRTTYDTNFATLEAILGIWQGAQTYSQRIAALQAAGPNQLKINTTVFIAPGQSTTGGPRFGRGNFVYQSNLVGNGGGNWFITNLLITVLNRKAGEVVTVS